MKPQRRFRPLDSRLAPFAGAAVLAWIVVPIGSTVDWSQYAISVVLLALTGAFVVARSAVGSPRWPGIVRSSFVFLIAVAVLRNSAGGISSAAGGLSLIPVFHTALYSRSRRDLGLVLAGVAAFYLVPIVIFGAPTYPDSQYRAALLSVMVSSIVGLATQRLVADVRHQAGEARRRERMLEQVGEVVHGLLESSSARADVCEAVRTIGDASMAILYEPVPETGALRSTAMDGLDVATIEVPAERSSALRDAFVSGEPILITENIEDRLATRDVWEASGRPQALLYQPLLRGGEPLGVLVVGWQATVAVTGSRASVVALLAHEAAMVIDRADELDQLTDMAQTDALTGLPNRRAWDLQIKRAVADQRGFAIAMLDFDHFKEFNDANGHPAGDRLLKEASAAWREQLRGGDLLARLGGEEFGLLLLDTDRHTASVVIERMREGIPHGRTCSAGVAIRVPGEASESVIARADDALYDAKHRGRDRTCVSA